MQKVTLGGDRLGSGNKQNITLHGYERSNHDLSYNWKSTMAPGTLVPFMNILALPGDTFDIDLDSFVRTHPTIGPLFGSMKLQLDVFTAPIRLYNKHLHNNKLNIDMASIHLPNMILTAEPIDLDLDTPPEFQQINQSSLFAYLGIRGLGSADKTDAFITATKNAVPYIAYWDIFKNYYANKQETNAYVIHGITPSITSIESNGDSVLPITVASYPFIFHGVNLTADNFEVQLSTTGWITMNDAAFINPTTGQKLITWWEPGKYGMFSFALAYHGETVNAVRIKSGFSYSDITPSLHGFPLENLDNMREALLTYNVDAPYSIFDASMEPYNLPIVSIGGGSHNMHAVCGQEGLAVKTYQSDIFNNWISNAHINAVNTASAIAVVDNEITVDQINLSKKVYDLLNRIAVSGGSYEDWISATFDHNSKWRAEAPVYHGGLSKEIVFEQIVSTAATANEPLGSLAGRGTMGDKHKGGKIIINVDEPCFIMGIVSITPRISYSQGNDWTTLLKTLDDLHKPALDGIGFQDLITDQMHFGDTFYDSGSIQLSNWGKQPAWLNYMTNYDKNYGNFADPRSQQFMTLDRRYELDYNEDDIMIIKDLTTYIDPAKFNYAFAQVDLSAQNFWTQIACSITARRKMSAKIIPNL